MMLGKFCVDLTKMLFLFLLLIIIVIFRDMRRVVYRNDINPFRLPKQLILIQRVVMRTKYQVLPKDRMLVKKLD
jgi:hypothetical protein